MYHSTGYLVGLPKSKFLHLTENFGAESDGANYNTAKIRAILLLKILYRTVCNFLYMKLWPNYKTASVPGSIDLVRGRFDQGCINSKGMSLDGAGMVFL